MLFAAGQLRAFIENDEYSMQYTAYLESLQRLQAAMLFIQ